MRQVGIVDTVYWAPKEDAAAAADFLRARNLPRGGPNPSDVHVLASSSHLRPALRALVTARGTGSHATFTLLGQEQGSTATPAVTSLLAACAVACDRDAGMALAVPIPDGGLILFDLTTSVMSSGPPTGIARIESDLFRAIRERARDRVVPIVWNRQTGNFVVLPSDTHPGPIASGTLSAMEADGRSRALTQSIADGSQIVVTGGTWTRRQQFIDALVRARAQCAAPVTLLIHDLAQTKLKHLYPETAAAFEANAKRMVATADRLLLFSDATQSDVQGLLADTDLPFKPIGRFVMGSTLAAPSGLSSVPGALRDLAGKRFALYVSSIEPRKNHRMLVEVWRRLVARRGERAPALLCVGRPVMNGQELIDDVRRDAELGPHIHFATGLGDEELEWCYRNAAFTLYPSLYEGWGLPIAESLLHGKVCIASNASSMREVAPALTDLVDPNDVDAWTDKISFYFDNPAALAARESAIRAEYKPHHWRESAQQILDALAIPSTMPPVAVVQPSVSLKPMAPEDNDRLHWVLGEGWAVPTRSGAAMSAARSSIPFTYLGTRRFSVRLKFAARKDIGEPQVEVEGGTVVSTFRRGLGALDLTISRPEAFGETRIWLRAKPGTIVTRIDVADTVADLDRMGGSRTPNPLLRIGRRILSRLKRSQPGGKKT